MLNQTKKCYSIGQPILIGTASVEKSEFLADFSSSSITENFSTNGKLELNTPQYLKITTGNIERALTDYLKVSVFTDAMYKMDKEGDNAGDTLGTKVSFYIDLYCNFQERLDSCYF